jgi:hypothetical protein
VKGHDWGDVLGLVFVLAVVFVMVRPSSKAPLIIATLGQAFASVISFATGAPAAGAGASGVGAGIGSGV